MYEVKKFQETYYSYILQGLTIAENIQTIIEPFACNSDLLEFIKTNPYPDRLKDTTCAFQFIPKTEPTKPNNLNIFNMIYLVKQRILFIY